MLRAHGWGHDETVEMLLEKGAVMADIADIIVSWEGWNQ